MAHSHRFRIAGVLIRGIIYLTSRGSAARYFVFVLGFLTGSLGTPGSDTAKPAGPALPPPPPPIRLTFDLEELGFRESVVGSFFCARAVPLSINTLAATSAIARYDMAFPFG
jgi:hypothetical protein